MAEESIDAHIGSQIRRLRLDQGLSEEALAAAIGLPVSDVKALEQGQRRVTPSVLLKIAQTCDVPMSHFFQESGEVLHFPDKLVARKVADGLELIRIFHQTDEASRREIIEFARSRLAGCQVPSGDD